VSVPGVAESTPRERKSVRLSTVLVRGQARYPLMQGVALVLLFLYGTESIDGFASILTLRSLAVVAAFLGLAALGQTIVILIGGLDLSVPAYIAVGSVFSSQVAGAAHWSIVITLALLVVLTAAAGALTGFIADRFQVQSLVLTLGVQAIVFGILQVWLKGAINGTPPAWLGTLASPATKTFGIGIPPMVVIWAVVAVMAALTLRRTIIGRWIYATGANPRAARLALVPTTAVWMIAFATSAVGASLVGVLLSGFAGGGGLAIGNDYLFESIAAVVVGGTALVGARGDYWRTVLGTLLIVLISTILVGHGASDATEQIMFGVVILVVVFGYGRNRHLRNRI